ncbi:MAG: hypothetical protein WB710_02590, partial [Stellaceae bacterium]
EHRKRPPMRAVRHPAVAGRRIGSDIVHQQARALWMASTGNDGAAPDASVHLFRLILQEIYRTPAPSNRIGIALRRDHALGSPARFQLYHTTPIRQDQRRRACR